MRSTQNKSVTAALTLLLVCAACGMSAAAEKPASLRIVSRPGLILLDSDTLNTAAGAPLEIGLEPGEHVLRYFPYHTAGEWVHRYLVYPFSVGSDGHRTIDLTSSAVFAFRTDPQAAQLRYRGRDLGRTPGKYLLLSGVGDSVSVSLPGYEPLVVRLDDVPAGSREIFCSLDPRIAGIDDEESLNAYQYQSPVRKLLVPDLMVSFTTGAALLALGAYFNKRADDHYERYRRLLGPSAREREYSATKRNDRLSKVSFILGDTALGVFGYLLVRRFIFPVHKRVNLAGGQQRREVSMRVTTSGARLSFKF